MEDATVLTQFTDLTASPVNRFLHFALELTVWIAAAAWGWQNGGAWRWVLAIALPILVVFTWTRFSVPLDPWLPGGPHGDQPWTAVWGWVRLTYEIVVHVGTVWVLVQLGWTPAAWAFGAGFVLHYAVSWQRIVWLLQAG